eukprot:CAMPEP_0177646258 /NCGR_PEP_ID=MMETSP0447-20121125/9680_1 /TAXON_ID=0 /ORGANISM="Stygamoeba regulata, Strain BSH-02190019" /LENGTH=381 /DNA_ID=CAMNT_0019148783 /DNA_START=197 /DNA_END=1342 /DNA_ORIENTATION=+
MGGSGSSNRKFVVGEEVWSRERLIGRGAFGDVYAVYRECKDGTVKEGEETYFAMKILNKAAVRKEKMLEYTQSELRMLQELHSPFIVNLHMCFQFKDHLALLMDLLGGGELRYHLNQYLGSHHAFGTKQIRFFAAGIMEGLHYIHMKHIVHRDIKPENILLSDNGYPCLTDFNIAVQLKSDTGHYSSRSGTLDYFSPEVLAGKGDYKADYWAMGVVLFEVAMLRRPWRFDASGKLAQAQKKPTEEKYADYAEVLRKGVERMSFDLGADAEAVRPPEQVVQDFLRALLEWDPDKRLKTYDEVRAHPLFEGFDWDALTSLKMRAPFVPSSKANVSGDLVTMDFADDLRFEELSEADPDFDGMVWSRMGTPVTSRPFRKNFQRK